MKYPNQEKLNFQVNFIVYSSLQRKTVQSRFDQTEREMSKSLLYTE